MKIKVNNNLERESKRIRKLQKQTLNTKSSNAGITLVALVVTIIVLIILAGVSMNLLLGDNGIITKAQEAKRVQEIAEIKSNIQLDIMAKEAEVLANRNKITTAQIEAILGKYGTVNKDGETITSLTPTGKDYEIPFEEIYIGLNSIEHTGLYYNQPYTFIQDGEIITYIFNEDGAVDEYISWLYYDSWSFTISDNGTIEADGVVFEVSNEGSKLLATFSELNGATLEFLLNTEPHGIYFGEMYSVNVEGTEYGQIFYEDGSGETYVDGLLDSEFVSGIFKYSGNKITMPEEVGGDTVLYVSLDGTQIIEPKVGIYTYTPSVVEETIQTYGTAKASSGDGYALYNGVKLPNIDSVWRDKATYPYAYIAVSNGITFLVASSSETSFETNGSYYSDTHAEAFDYVSWVMSDGSAWSEFTSGFKNANGYTSHLKDFTITWSNHEVLHYNSEETYLAASESISLDGMQVIEWDGDTTGLVRVDDFYKVSDIEFKPSHTFSYYITYSGLTGQVGSGTNADFIDQSGALIDSVNGLVFSAYTTDVVTETGLYFAKIAITGDYVNLFAYTPQVASE